MTDYSKVRAYQREGGSYRNEKASPMRISLVVLIVASQCKDKALEAQKLRRPAVASAVLSPKFQLQQWIFD